MQQGVEGQCWSAIRRSKGQTDTMEDVLLWVLQWRLEAQEFGEGERVAENGARFDQNRPPLADDVDGGEQRVCRVE